MSADFDRIKKARRSHLESRDSFIRSLHPICIDEHNEVCNVAQNNMGGVPLLCEGNKAYVDASDVHTLVIGSTGSKKTRLLAMPTIWALGAAGESIIVSDPKGEIFAACGRYLEHRGYHVQVVDFRRPGTSEGWNPLARPFRYLLEGKEAVCYQMINDLSFTFMNINTSKNDPFWDYAAGSVLIGLCLLLMELCADGRAGKDAVSLSNVCWLRQVMFDGGVQKSDGLLRKFLWKYAERFPSIYSYLVIGASAAEKTNAGVLSTFDSKMILFKIDPDTASLLSRNDVDIECLASGPNALFIIYPDEKSTYNSIVSLFVKQSYECLIGKAYSSQGGVLSNRVNYVLDEFSSLPPITDFPSMITAGRSRGIRFDLFIQSEYQLKLRYDCEADTIMSNCSNWVLLRTRDLEFLQKFSLLCGDYEWDGIRREVLSISDLQRLEKDDGEAVILHGNQRPFITSLEDINRYGIVTMERSDSTRFQRDFNRDLDDRLKQVLGSVDNSHFLSVESSQS